MRIKLHILLVTTLFLPWSLWCQTPENTALTLEQCISITLQQNPLILSSLQQHQASLARISQAKALPQPSIGYDSDLQPKFFNFKDSGESYFGLSQSIEFPGKRHLRGKIASKESNEIMAEIDFLKLDIVFHVKQAFYGLLLAQEKLKYAQQDLELAQDFLKKAELKFDAGDVAKVEALRARVESAKAANEVSIPLFFWQPKKGEIREAQANVEALKREAEHLKNAITLEVEEAYMNALTASNMIQLFEEEMLTQAEEVYNMFLFSYQEGEIGGIELIEARRTLLETRKSYADALYNYDASLAAMEKSIGQTLEGEKQ